MIVSHDAHLLQCTCDEVWHVKRGMVEKFKGNIDEFKDVLLKENKRALEEAARQRKDRTCAPSAADRTHPSMRSP